jgi:hypothetical protein
MGIRAGGGIVSFFASGVAALLLMQIPASAGWLLTGMAYYATAAVIGCALGILFGQRSAAAVGWGTFAAGALLSMPVVLVAYGFALAGAPLVVAFGVVAGAGAYFAGRIKESRSAV